MNWKEIEGVGALPYVQQRCADIARVGALPDKAVEAYPEGQLPFISIGYTRKDAQRAYFIRDLATSMNIKKDEQYEGAIPHVYIVWYSGRALSEKEFQEIPGVLLPLGREDLREKPKENVDTNWTDSPSE